MDTRASYLIQILEKIGSPLMQSIVSGAADSTPEKDAQNMAGLLGKVVQSSIDIGNLIDIAKAGEESDSIRLALAGVSGPLVAEQFAKDGKVPEEADLKKLTGALQAVLTFSENFTPSEDNALRLKDIAAAGQKADSHQINVQYIQAFVPVVAAVHGFSFGQQPQKLIMDIARRITDKAMALRENAFQDLSEEDQKRVELAFVKTGADIYAACHDGETKRMAAGGEQKGIEAVWSAFDTRMAMVEALAQNMTPGANIETSSGTQAPIPPPAPPAAPPAETAAAPPPAETQAPPPAQPETPPPPPEAPPTAPETPPAAQDSGTNPMGFFAKKPDGDAATPPPPPAAPAQPETPTPPPADPPPAAPPPPPAEEPKKEEKPAGDNSQGNPMSFFTKKDDED